MEDMPGKGTTTDDVAVLRERLATVERSAAEKEQHQGRPDSARDVGRSVPGRLAARWLARHL